MQKTQLYDAAVNQQNHCFSIVETCCDFKIHYDIEVFRHLKKFIENARVILKRTMVTNHFCEL